MKRKSIQYESEAFSCEQRGKFAANIAPNVCICFSTNLIFPLLLWKDE
jgi:hypothetical protein